MKQIKLINLSRRDPRRKEKKTKISIFTLLGGASKGFMKALFENKNMLRIIRKIVNGKLHFCAVKNFSKSIPQS